MINGSLKIQIILDRSAKLCCYLATVKEKLSWIFLTDVGGSVGEFQTAKQLSCR